MWTGYPPSKEAIGVAKQLDTIDMYEYQAVTVVQLPEGGTFDAEIGGTMWAANWEEAEHKMRQQTESADCKLKSCEMVRHTSGNGRITRQIDVSGFVGIPTSEPCTYKPNPAIAEPTLWLPDCEGLTPVKDSTVWWPPIDTDKAKQRGDF
jgi:hypothetical protein